MVAHTAGGTFGPNMFPQDRGLNRGWSAKGRRYRWSGRSPVRRAPSSSATCSTPTTATSRPPWSWGYSAPTSCMLSGSGTASISEDALEPPGRHPAAIAGPTWKKSCSRKEAAHQPIRAPQRTEPHGDARAKRSLYRGSHARVSAASDCRRTRRRPKARSKHGRADQPIKQSREAHLAARPHHSPEGGH